MRERGGAGERKPRRHPFREEDRPWLSFGLYAGLFVSVCVPLLIVLMWSLVSKGNGWFAPRLAPPELSVDFWRDILKTGDIFGSITLSLVIALAVTSFTSVLAFPTAYALARFPFKMKKAVEVYILAPLIVPGIVVAVGMGELFYRLGFQQSVVGVILAQTVGTLPLMIRLLAATLEGIPSDIIHAARTLGATQRKAAVHVVIPMSIQGFMAGWLLNFIASFEEFDKTFIVGAPLVQTLPVRLFSYIDGGSVVFPLAAVVSFLLLAPMILVFYLAGRVVKDDVMSAGMGKL
jgi:multiple sugar transport system permease protein/putative spermidine/putrescine transport system permease protein